MTRSLRTLTTSPAVIWSDGRRPYAAVVAPARGWEGVATYGARAVVVVDHHRATVRTYVRDLTDWS
jgi:hypothetical protein